MSTAGADCIKDIGGAGATSASVRARLMSTEYYAADLGVGSNGTTMAAATLMGTSKVVLNANAFFTPTQAPTINAAGVASNVNLLSIEAIIFGLNYGKMTIDDWQAATLLHELGHERGGLKDDRFDLNINLENSRKIWRDCFPDLKL